MAALGSMAPRTFATSNSAVPSGVASNGSSVPAIFSPTTEWAASAIAPVIGMRRSSSRNWCRRKCCTRPSSVSVSGAPAATLRRTRSPSSLNRSPVIHGMPNTIPSDSDTVSTATIATGTSAPGFRDRSSHSLRSSAATRRQRHRPSAHEGAGRRLRASAHRSHFLDRSTGLNERSHQCGCLLVRLTKRQAEEDVVSGGATVESAERSLRYGAALSGHAHDDSRGSEPLPQVRWCVEHDQPLLEHRDAVRLPLGFVEIVRRQQDRASRRPSSIEHPPHAAGDFGIQARRRLVEQQHVRIVEQRAAEGDLLAQSLRQLRGPGVRVRAELEDVDQLRATTRSGSAIGYRRA